MMGGILDPKNSDKLPTKKSGKTVVLALLAAILGVFAIVVVIGMTGGSQHVPGAQPGIGFVKADVGPKDEPDDDARAAPAPADAATDVNAHDAHAR